MVKVLWQPRRGINFSLLFWIHLSLEEVLFVVHELGNRDIIRTIKEFRHWNLIVGARWSIQELSNSDIVGALVEEFSDWNVILFEKLVDGAIVKEEVRQSSLHELGDSDIVVLEEFGSWGVQELDHSHFKILSHCNIVFRSL